MIDWEFNADDYSPNGFLIPVGKYRVRIEDAEAAKSKAGNNMIKLTLKVSGYTSQIWHYLVLNPEKREYTNQKLGELWNSFNIPMGNFNLEGWKGKVGGANIKHEPDNDGNMQARVSYFLKREDVEKLPAWQEKGSNTSNTGNIDAEMYDPFN